MSRIFVDRISPYQSGSIQIDGYEAAIDTGSFATTGSNQFIGNQDIAGNTTIVGNTLITGSLTVSGSAGTDFTLIGRQLISGPTSGQTPNLFISSSDNNILFNRTNISLRKSGTAFPGNLARNNAQFYSAPGDATTVLISNFDESFVDNVDFQILVDAITGTKVQDWDNATFGYDDVFTIGPNVGTTPDVEFKRSLQVTGSVEISDVLQLSQKDPLPAGAVGQLAVSASNLYYHNGSSWSQIN